MNETHAAIEAFARVESLAPRAAIAAEAQRVRFALAQPMAALEVEAVQRAARASEGATLDALAVRARRLAQEHATWPAWVALGAVERRRGALASARDALVAALGASAGCGAAHRELARTYVAMNDATSAMEHATRAVVLEGETGATLGALAAALACAGRRADADATLARALALSPDDDELRASAPARDSSRPRASSTR